MLGMSWAMHRIMVVWLQVACLRDTGCVALVGHATSLQRLSQEKPMLGSGVSSGWGYLCTSIASWSQLE